MKSICDILEHRISAALADLAGGPAAALVKPTQDPKFGDYQANGIMALAKKLKRNPRQLAQQIVEKLDLADMCAPPQIAGPGFINLKLKPDWLAARLTEAIADTDRLGVDPLDNPPTVVIDFSGPNIAKQMHVGHLRSTIIGDVIARVLDFYYGDPKKVIRQNHVGDWGTQFGMLIAYLDELNFPQNEKDSANANDNTSVEYLKFKLSQLNIPDMEEFYRQAKNLFDADKDFEEESRDWVVKLQSGDGFAKVYWTNIRDQSLDECQKLYDQLNVELNKSNVRGESYYNKELPAVIAELSAADLLVQSQGARCVFLEGFKTKDGEPLPLIVQKSDGAYLYATTDLAAIRYRVDQLKADRVIYVTDARQKLHFRMVFGCARRAGWADDTVALEHVPFGSVLGANGKPLKTRSGENIKLKDLLCEAESRALEIVEQKNPQLSPDQKATIAHAVGIGAVKYADLSSNLISDYVFDWNKMLAMDGNTAPYMQYAYARVQSIFRKGAVNLENLLAAGHPIELTTPEELTLAHLLLRYAEIVETVAGDLRPHLLTTYLFELAQAFSGFYTNCPVLKAQGPTRNSRLLLCCQTARTIAHGLDLLGIETIEKM